jgi:hypothetical protein
LITSCPASTQYTRIPTQSTATPRGSTRLETWRSIYTLTSQLLQDFGWLQEWGNQKTFYFPLWRGEMDSHCLDCFNISTATQHKMHNITQQSETSKMTYCSDISNLKQPALKILLSLLTLNSSMSCSQEVPVSLEFHHNKQLY